MKNICFILISSFICLYSCQQDLPYNSEIELPSYKFLQENLVIDVATVDSFSIHSADELIFEKPFFYEIIFKYYSPEKLSDINDTIIPIYTLAEGGYYIDFSFEKKFKQFNIPLFFDLNITFKESSGQDRSIDLKVEMFKYLSPYSQIYQTKNICPENVVIWNFEIVGEDLYFIATTTDDWLTHFKFYKYDLVLRQLKHLFTTHASYYLAANANYIFYEPTHGAEFVDRYDLKSTEKIEIIYIYNSGYNLIHDIAIYEDKLYVVAQKERTGMSKSDILQFDFDGNLLRIIPFNHEALIISIHNGILYFINQDPGIHLYNIEAQQFENYKISGPDFYAASIYGIKIYDYKLYYADHFQSIIGFIDLHTLEKEYF